MFGKRRDAASYDADAAALFARWGTDPGSTRKQLYSDCIAGLKTDSVWSLLDEVQMYAAHTQADGLLGWKNVRNATVVNSPTFTTDRGIATNGSTSYIDTAFVPSTDGVAYTDPSACYGAYINDVGAGSSGNSIYSTGAVGTFFSRLVPRDTAGRIRAIINSTTSLTFTSTAPGTRLGLSTVDRPSGADAIAYRNGSSVGTVADASTGVPDVAFFVGGQNNSGSLGGAIDSRFAFWFAGASLNSTKQTALYNRFLTLLTAIGAN